MEGYTFPDFVEMSAWKQYDDLPAVIGSADVSKWNGFRWFFDVIGVTGYKSFICFKFLKN